MVIKWDNSIIGSSGRTDLQWIDGRSEVEYPGDNTGGGVDGFVEV
jgi:hypothetical protein